MDWTSTDLDASQASDPFGAPGELPPPRPMARGRAAPEETAELGLDVNNADDTGGPQIGEGLDDQMWDSDSHPLEGDEVNTADQTHQTDDGGPPLLTIREAYDIFSTEMLRDGNVDLSGLAKWTASSSKPGHGVEMLRDGTYTTWWQSDGCLPHHIDVQFSKRVKLNHVSLFCDYVEDESYTPRSLTIYCGSGPYDLVCVHRYTLDKPEGWSCLLLDRSPHPQYGSLSCWYVRIEINSNHQNGKDAHIREIRMLGPRQHIREPL